MKISVPNKEPKSPKTFLLPLIEDDEMYRLDKSNSVVYNLKTQPAAGAGSPEYKYQVRVLQGTEDVRAILKWKGDVFKVCVGLNVTTLDK